MRAYARQTLKAMNKVSGPADAESQVALRAEFRNAVSRRKLATANLLKLGVLAYELAAYLPAEDWSRFAVLTCGAKTRAGTPCKLKALYGCGRCRLHGGLSTGPRTPAGKKKSASNGMLPKRTP